MSRVLGKIVEYNFKYKADMGFIICIRKKEF